MAYEMLKETTLDVLSKARRNINFNLNGLIVTGQRYARVADLVRSGHIGFEVRSQILPTPGMRLKPGSIIEAQYEVSTNKMVFRREDYGSAGSSGISPGAERGVILHEATHAMFDVFAKSENEQVLLLDDESAAVLAQALYLKYCQTNDLVALHAFIVNKDGSGPLAVELADAIMGANAGERQYDLQPRQMVRFRNRVGVEWDLVKEGDRDTTGVPSNYNGVIISFASWGYSLCPSHGAKAGASLRGGAAVLGDVAAGPRYIKIQRLL